VLVAGEVDDPVDLAGGVQVPDERPGRVDLAVSAHEVAAVEVDDVVAPACRKKVSALKPTESRAAKQARTSSIPRLVRTGDGGRG
jgi:hypothetical protein